MNVEDFLSRQISEIRQKVSGRAIAALSGGVDSTVAALISRMALGDRVVAVYVDTGLMRKGESEKLAGIFSQLGMEFRMLDASEEFLNALAGIEDPEQKRLTVGGKFIETFEREAAEHGAEYLVQGTIAPDWIESGDSARDRIKAHHNVGGLPPSMRLKLVEPIRDLYKDEVREVARHLGISTSERQPFPGPGLAIRVMGAVTRERIEIVREACTIVEEEIESANKKGELERLPWQYFAVLIPVRSVGVQGDVRVYGETIVVRSVSSKDAMTARFSDLPHDLLERISTRITNRLGNRVTRVVFDITNKPPATIEWE